ncbi:uncharacterized protein LOC128996890 [Macrosteles quadrilineatus]|uniref:uncharacterized protein LOC128996890 n=1 Tax=Macrosteles quadrilineatus TaxID=74068 RepID=UPI0023E1598A|nr:uncharacterized protein LOC128996890 [Macrosteles quadrilineatus]
MPGIPYPRPSPSVELRGGQIYSGCQCVKRDGLQHDCPRTGCQGRAICMAYPAPLCVPSGNSPTPPSKTGQKEVWANGGQHQAGAVSNAQENYVRMGRRGYRENPPVKRHPRLPCDEHRNPRR